jgi:hypothetical protein
MPGRCGHLSVRDVRQEYGPYAGADIPGSASEIKWLQRSDVSTLPLLITAEVKQF